MVYFCYSSSLNVCVAYIFLFWIAIWPLCGKVTGFLLVMFPLGSSYFMFVFFPFDVSDGRCGIIVLIPDHCLPFYFHLCGKGPCMLCSDINKNNRSVLF